MRHVKNLTLLLSLLFLSACGMIGASKGSIKELPTAEQASSRAALRRPPAKLSSVPIRPPIPPIQLRDAPQVRAMLRRYTETERSFVIDSLKRGEVYMPMIESVFRQHRIPFELSNVAMIESRFIKTAKSHRGAKGMWQFIKSTARLYGLKVSLLKDERKNPRLSTIAAAKFLKDLHGDFDDWLLAIGAYNSGPAKIRRAIKRCGTRDFFKFHSCGGLRKETLDFVAKFVALTLVTRHPDIYGFEKELGAKSVRRLLLRARRNS